jgi:hypothetical protein
MLVAHEFFDALKLPIRVLQVIQVFLIIQTRFVLIYPENR